MSLRFLVIGKTGQSASALVPAIKNSGHKFVFLDRNDCDLSGSSSAIRSILDQQIQADIVIIAAAYTAVDQAETDVQTAMSVNGVAPGVIAKYCADRSIPLIYISTDYVFDGDAQTPYLTDHPTSPISVYGQSKLAGELNIINSDCRSAILRTSWVFDGTRKNFLTTMLRLAQEKDDLSIVADQIGRPTYAGHLANAVIRVAESLCDDCPHSHGVFNVTGSGDPTNWADFARAIFAMSKDVSRPVNVNSISSSDYPTPAKRPKYSVLDLNRFEQVFEYALPDWREGLREALNERN